MDEKKKQRYLAIAEKLTELVGGKKNIQGVAHCATRLRIVLENNDIVDLKAIEDLDLAKGVFVAGDQLQIIFGAGLVGFQGGIIVALLMGVVTAKLDIFFEKKVPEVVRLLVSPLLTTLVGAILLFTVIGPIGRGLASGLTGGLVWMTENLGVFGYAVFSGLQQLVVITGLHHVFGAIEAQLLADTGRNILNPLMSVAIIAQGGAVLGYLSRNYKDAKTKELCIPSFISVLFGITEPALFGINLRFKYPIVGGCIGGAIGGAVVYFTNLAALGFGTTVVPGIALADPTGNGYLCYVIAHLTALACGFILTFIFGAFQKKVPAVETPAAKSADTPSPAAAATAEPAKPAVSAKDEKLHAYADGQMISITEVKDATFAQKILGEGFAIIPETGAVHAPVNGTIASVFDTKHAICIVSEAGQLLVSFELDKISAEGYDTVIPMVFTDADNQPDMSGLNIRHVKQGEII